MAPEVTNHNDNIYSLAVNSEWVENVYCILCTVYSRAFSLFALLFHVAMDRGAMHVPKKILFRRNVPASQKYRIEDG